MSPRHRDIVAVGASAGGVEALRALVAGLPPDYPGTVLVVLHVPRTGPSALPAILSRSGALPATTAVDGEALRPGHIVVAPNDHHLLLLDGHVRLTRGPSENGHRPAIDPLFRSVARGAGDRAVGVVLSGTRDDGAAGLAAITARGGVSVVQDPGDALYPWMPRAAIAQSPPRHVLPAAGIGDLLSAIIAADLPAQASSPGPEAVPSEPAGFGCPSCGGSLFLVEDQPVPRYRCRIGHGWSPESLLDEQDLALESALWTALRALEEKSALSRRMAVTRLGRATISRTRFEETAQESEDAGATIRRLIDRLGARTEPL